MLDQIQPDHHVHTEWSWDAPRGSMERTCRRAVEVGVAAVAFTEHADFDQESVARGARFNVQPYLEELEQCRARYPGLRILSGVELGGPHRFPAAAAAILAAGPLDRVLGSVHQVPLHGRLTEVSERGVLEPGRARDVMRLYLQEVLALVESGQPFEVLAHLDYPKRYWPHGRLAYVEAEYAAEFRSVLEAAAGRDLVLEINTKGTDDPMRFCPGETVVRWWHAAGGKAVSFGSDAHRPQDLARGFRAAAELAEAAGFKPGQTALDFWGR